MEKQGYRIAVAGVALGLVAFIFGAALVLRTGHHVSAAYWTAGSAVSGALLGLLAPTPSASKQTKATAASRAAVQAEHHEAAANRAAGKGHPADKLTEEAHTAAAKANADVASAKAPISGAVALVGLFLVFAAALWVGIADNLTQMQSLAAAAGGAIIGIIAPSPSAGDPPPAA
jgi:hypothetical protein